MNNLFQTNQLKSNRSRCACALPTSLPTWIFASNSNCKFSQADPKFTWLKRQYANRRSRYQEAGKDYSPESRILCRDAAIKFPALISREFFRKPLSEEAIAGLDRADRAYRLRNNPYLETAGLEAEPEPEQLAAVAALISDEVMHRASKEARLLVQFDDEGRALGIANEYCGDAIMGFIYRAIAYRGASAHLTAEDRDELARAGRSQAEIDAIHRLKREISWDRAGRLLQ